MITITFTERALEGIGDASFIIGGGNDFGLWLC